MAAGDSENGNGRSVAPLGRTDAAANGAGTVGAVLFVDLTGFRELTRIHGDEAAADAATRFVALVRSALVPGSRVVKTLGDGVLIVSPDAAAARATASRIRSSVAADASLPPVHAGICAGSVVWRDGDVYGAAVNDAARLADAARPWQIVEARSLTTHGSPSAEGCLPPELAAVEATG